MAAARIQSIEGLRALAITSVLLYHLEVSWLPSGHMGVVMFLVLTGYLITNSILREWDREGRVSLVSLWTRRLKRLWLPMAAMILVVAVVCVACNHVVLTKMRPDILPSLLFFDNWNYILNGLSYFDKIGSPSPLTHLWYLGVDMQLCVLWPLVLVGVLKVSGGNRVAGATVAGVLAVASAVAMALLYVPGADPSRVYYGCDTRAFAVLAGAALAFAWPLGYMPIWGRKLMTAVVGRRRFEDPRAPRGYVDRPVFGPSTAAKLAGIVALVAIVIIMVAVPATSTFFFYGGMALVAVLCLALMATLLSPNTPLTRAFSHPVLQWLGSRSFALYLWHYPVIVLLDADGGAAWWLKLVAALVSLALAEISWRLVEKPLSDKSLAERIRHEGLAFFTVMPRLAGTVACAILLLVAVIGCVLVPETTLVPKDAITSTGVAADKAMDLTSGRAGAPAQGGQVEGNQAAEATDATQAEVPSTDPATAVVEEPPVEAPQAPASFTLPDGILSFAVNQPAADGAAGKYAPILIGDSVPPEDYFYDAFPTGHNDSYIGRMPSQAFSIFSDYVAQGVVGRAVVFACFSNTTPWPEELEAMVASAPAGTQIYLVGTVNPDGFQDAANANLIQCASNHDNVHYVDWPAVCWGHESEYLWGDMTHLQPTGEQAYIDMIARALAQDMVEVGGTITYY